MGRVARRIWAVAMRERYGANERSQKLKYHCQTSGRSLHAQEIAFNDIRTTLQALDRDLRQRQQPAHQRLRRGDHHADRGERAPRHGDPAHHQPRVGAGEEREPQPGRLHHRRAHRAGGGGGAEGVRGAQRARRRAGRHGAGLPARQDPGGVAALRAPEAHRRVPDHRREHLPQPARRPDARRRWSSRARPRRRRRASSSACTTSSAATRRGAGACSSG